jgi:FtsH-binding integral membrane protein
MWPFIGSTALAISIIGPSYLADGISAACLICLHILVGVVLVTGFMRAAPQPSRPADQAAG